MKVLLIVLVSFCYVNAETKCIIDLDCEECLPEHMPLIQSHPGGGRLSEGEEVRLSCRQGRFLLLPHVGTVRARCQAGQLRLPDGSLRRLLELGCQESVFEDVLHHVESCPPPFAGRVYQHSGGGKHLATLCFDPDRAVPLRLRARPAGLHMAPHHHSASPLSVLGNFNHMFDTKTRSDAERLFSDDVRMNRRLRESLKHEEQCFAGQTLTSARLLPPTYFLDQDRPVANFVSNKVPVWTSVAEGNWKNLQKDVSAILMRNNSNVEVFAGTHGVATSSSRSQELFLKPERRFPVPRYLWTVVLDTHTHKAIALVTLNDPFVPVSRIKESVFCESLCGQVSWLKELHTNRNYETPLYGLVFCCSVTNFTAAVPEMEAAQLRHVSGAADGLLLNLDSTDY